MQIEIKNWQLAYLDEIDSTGSCINGISDWTDVVVPHNVQQCGFKDIKEVFFSENIKLLSWTEKKIWVYKTTLKIENEQDKKYILEFHGLDYLCKIYLNEQLLLEHEGMFSKVNLDITDKINSEINTIWIVFYLTEDMRNYDLKHHTFKCQNSYKWDAAPRMLTMGIWDKVFLYEKNKVYIEDFFIKSHLKSDGSASITIETDLNDSFPGSKIQITFGNVEYIHEVNAGKNQVLEFIINSPELWNPVGYGDPYQYDVNLKLISSDGTLADEKNVKYGVRNIKMVHCPGQEKGHTPLQLTVNDKAIFIKGSNIVPLDVFPATLNKERYDLFLQKVVECNINLLRVWGGGLVEKDIFYSLCDRYGIMVWQDFQMACNNPPDNEVFLNILEKEASSIIKKIRNHCSIIFLCGGNELYVDWSRLKNESEKAKIYVDEIRGLITPFNEDTYMAGANKYEEPSLKLLNSLCNKFDGTRPFHISSPLEGEGEMHGPWGYDLSKGDHRYRLEDKTFYEFWNNCHANLYSEAGCSAITNIDAYRKNISRDQQWPIKLDSVDLVFHNAFGAAWNSQDQWLDLDITKKLFGHVNNLEDLIWANQYLQAEGVRYIIEECRRKKPYASGMITWSFNETWPNAASLSIIDYYLEPKKAYWYTKKSYSNVIATLRYENIVIDGSQVCQIWIDADNIGENEKLNFNWEILNDNLEIIAQGHHNQISLKIGEPRHIEDIIIEIGGNKAMFVKLNISNEVRGNCINIYAFGNCLEKYPLRELLSKKQYIDHNI